MTSLDLSQTALDVDLLSLRHSVPSLPKDRPDTSRWPWLRSTPPPAPPLEQVAEQIRRIIANERYAALMKGLRDKAKVQISDN